VPACADSSGSFIFLNRQIDFSSEVDWRFNENGKLWNYNLQYANFILQENITLQTRLNWLTDLYYWLDDGRLPLEPYPVSLRSINVIRLISREGVKDNKILEFLYAELNFLSGRFEYHLLGNHLLENAFALFMGGAFFNNHRWLAQAQKVLKEELEEQILNDGGHFELSAMYHQVILYRVLELADWYSTYPDKQVSFIDIIFRKAEIMLAWLQNITFSTGEVPQFNDCAPGIAYSTKQLLGYAAYLKIKPETNWPLSDSGYRIYHGKQYECAVDVAAIGPAYQSGHGHADVLSFILYYKGQPLLVEAGTSTYDNGDARKFERSTAAHNTVVVNRASSSQVWDSFRVGSRARVKIIKEEGNLLIANHNGYLKSFNIMHQRSFEFGDSKIHITDELSGPGCNSIAYFHLAPNISYTVNANKVLLNDIGVITFSDAEINTGSYFCAKGFYKVSEAVVIEVKFNNLLRTEIDLY
jgi:uncharacterized heparinase superfamily protein